ncbi:MAG: NAD-binding protein, partial [Clostridia bacterium]|nr:NAD-binding protein [Clostridia bacterium]
MKIIIAGSGTVGSTLAKQLSAEGHDLTLIDKNAPVLRRLVDEFDVMTAEGNCASMETLKSADVQNTDLLIATTDSDELNMLCCLTAR